MSMYLAHFGLTEAPFKITPHTEFFFAGANRGETLEALVFAVMSGEGMVKVTGEVGAGKTMLCRVLMERLPTEVETIYLAVPSISRDEILATIASDLGIEAAGHTTTKLIRALQQRLIDLHAAGKQVVALIDEAHAMPLETLEEIRLLSNLETNRDKLMQIVLFGQPELDAHLALPNMRQLRERITHSFNLQPLPPTDIRNYLNFRLRQAGYKGPDLFSGDAVKVIAEASEGLTRRINIFADKTLLAAYADGTHNVTAKHARAAVADTQIGALASPPPRRTWPVLAALVLGVAIGGAGGYFVGRQQVAVEAAPVAAASAKPIDRAPLASASSTVASRAGDAAPASLSNPASAKPEPAPAASTNVEPAVAATATPPVEKIQVAATIAGATKSEPELPRADGDWLGSRMRADLARFGTSNASGYAIQLMTAEERDGGAIRDFLRVAERELPADQLLVFPSGSAENPKVSVVYGAFTERSEANEQITKLSPRLRQFRPYVRSATAVRADTRPPV